jgi:hypothetical protein
MIAVGLAVLLAWPALAARAQAGVSLASLRVALWPEFDRPEALVIIDGTLTAGTPLPAEVSLRIPEAAGAPHAVATVGNDGKLLTASYTTNSAGKDIIVTFSTDSLSFRLEYYDPALVVADDTRTYVFGWTADYAVASAALRVQQPFGATDFTAEPALISTGAGEYGLSYWESGAAPLAAGQALSLTFSYSKADSTLSADAVGAEPASVPPATSAASTVSAASPNLPLVVAVGAFGVLLVGAGVFVYVRGARTARGRPAHGRGAAPRRSARQRRPARRASTTEPAQGASSAARQAAGVGKSAPGVTPRPAETASPAGGPVFCTQCGQRRLSGDRFCRQCGAAISE